MPNFINIACDFNHITHPLSRPEKSTAPGPLRRVAGAALLILSIPLTLGILTGLYLYWAHKKVVQIKKEETQAVDKTVQKLFGQQVGTGAQSKNSPFVRTAQSLYKGETEKAFEQMKALKTNDQLTEGATTALLEAAIEQNKIKLVGQILDEFPGIERIPLHKAKSAGMVTCLLNRKVDPNVSVDSEGNTPLHLAANVEVAKALIKGGAKVVLNNNHFTLLHTCRNPEIARFLTAKQPDGLGIPVNYTHEGLIPPPIFTVPLDVKIALIRDLGADPMISGTDGQNLLHSCEDLNLARVLLEKVDVNIKNRRRNTPLFTVQNPEVLRLLIEKGADVRATNDEEETILHCRTLPEDLLDLVLKEAEKVEGPPLLEVRNEDGDTPLTTLIPDEMKILLIKKGAETNVVDSQQRTPLYFCKTRELATILIEKGANVNSLDRYGDTPLHFAQNGEIAAFLLGKGADIDALDEDNLSPLLTADQNEVCKLLIERGADLTPRDLKGRGPLHLAAKRGDLETVQLLLEKGQDPNEVDQGGNTPLSLLLAKGQLDESRLKIVGLLAKQTNLKVVNKENKSALHYLLEYPPRTDLIQTFLDNGADPNICDKEGNPPLFYCRSKEAAELLVNKGANPKQVNSAGQTALFYAASGLHAEWLVEKCKVDIAAKDKQGRAALHTCKDASAIKWMIEKGGLDVNKIDKLGQTPLHKHCNSNHIVKLLLDHRATVNAVDDGGRTPLDFCNDTLAGMTLIGAGAKSFVVGMERILKRLNLPG